MEYSKAILEYLEASVECPKLFFGIHRRFSWDTTKTIFEHVDAFLEYEEAILEYMEACFVESQQLFLELHISFLGISDKLLFSLRR